tara:strand:- start:296 stop:427 length:132 start_codon:yes stop_codon:yes gene_type:complete
MGGSITARKILSSLHNKRDITRLIFDNKKINFNKDPFLKNIIF